MPDSIVVNVSPYEGEYEFDLELQPLSHVEWRWVKRISGYMPLTIEEGWKGGDPDLFLAFAVIAMHRAGRIEKPEVLPTAELIEDSAFDGAAIQFKGEVSDDADPPTISSPSDSTSGSGESTSADSEPSPETETAPDSGSPKSDSLSDRLTSVK